MADTPAFEIEALKRDWVAGLSGEALYLSACAYREQIELLTAVDRRRGVLLAESDPFKFAAVFFAALSLEVPIILANPKWGQLERAELAKLVAPALCFGLEMNDFSLNAPLPPRGAVLIPTGGSTGGVKLAIHNWESLSAACRGVQAFLGGGPINSCCVLPLFHVSGLMQLLRSFMTGGRIFFDDSQVEGRCLSYVATQLQRALSNPRRVVELKTAKAIFVGGGPMSDSLVERARAARLPVVPVYGMTETAAMVAAIPAADLWTNPSAGAQPIGDARLLIEDTGAIRIQSSALFLGYQGQQPVDLLEGYLTQDQGYLDADLGLHVVGRMDRIIISGGEKIDLNEVESALRQHFKLDEILACGMPDEEWGQRLVVFYVLSEDQAGLGNWRAQLKLHLAHFKIPKQMIVVEALPLDERGKLDRDRVRSILAEQSL